MRWAEAGESRFPRRRWPHPLGVAVFLLCLAVFLSSIAEVRGGTWVISVDGQPVARVADQKELDQVLVSLQDQYGEISGQPVEWARLKSVRVQGESEITLVDARELEERLAEALGFAQNAVSLLVDGEKRFVFADRAAAREFLARVKASYTFEDGAVADFKEDVRVVGMKVRSDEIIDPDEAVLLARQEIENIQEYTVREGDTLWDIAKAHGLTVEELLAFNPQLKENTILQIDNRLVIAREKPLLTVVTTAWVVEAQEVPYRTSVRRDPSLPAGQKKVLEPGKPGLEEVTYLVTRQNGRLIGREQLDSRQIKAPVARVEVSGSKIVLASRGSGGQLAWPTRGSVISPFGMRYGRMHEGIDIAAGRGTPVFAAEGGRVVRSGWHGGYGITVDLSHGNGVVTRYAHLSSTLVSAGQEVDRGQQIGAVGSTGNSSGPHLHFEVIINGKPQNPLNYL